MYTDSITPSDDLQVLLAARLRLQDFKLSVRKQYASHTGTHRAEIRQGLLEYLNLVGDRSILPGYEGLLDLRHSPQLPGKSISIAHCKKLGGFTCASAATPVGFSVDVAQKSQYENIEKICRDFAEWREASSSSSLWIGKEAAFKALVQEYPDLEKLTDLKIGQWVSSTAGIFEFFRVIELKGDVPPNLGCIVDLGEVKMGFFTYGPHCANAPLRF